MTALPDIAMAAMAGKTVLVRADLNVPMRDGAVTDRTRIERFAPTVADLAARGARVAVLTHLGRPKGEAKPEFSLAPLAPVLGELVGADVAFAEDCIGAPAQKIVSALPAGGVALLQNLRFHKEEEKNDAGFAAQLAALGDLYVNDAFSCAHRAHASTHALAKALPAFAGPSLMAEVNALRGALDAPKRPVAALVGGAKVSTKIGILSHLSSRMDHLIIGGGMANTFLAAQGRAVGKSLYEPDALDTARAVLAAAEKQGCAILLPSDVVVAGAFAANAPHETVAADAIPAEKMALDVGPATVAAVNAVVADCQTLLWNGPLGAFEIEPFGAATFAVARAAAQRTELGGLLTVAGGGDTVAALNAADVSARFSYLSTAGGAFLEWLEGRELPGIAVLAQA